MVAVFRLKPVLQTGFAIRLTSCYFFTSPLSAFLIARRIRM